MSASGEVSEDKIDIPLNANKAVGKILCCDYVSASRQF